MAKGEEIKIKLLESHIARIKNIRNQLLGEIQIDLRECKCSIEKKHLQNRLDYFNSLSIERLATLCFSSVLNADALVHNLKKAISLHVIFNNISNRS
ncbi:hypothetical protein [Lysinibacillus capsici]|uniref:hypothetical protein n=1 Tax=Lysinibacillus capsici TaxID=2115968 RepID=UPI001CDA2E0B|nr:hypothetical protein [Lysinibacillus capsici]